MKLKFVSGLIQIASLRFIEALEGSKIRGERGITGRLRTFVNIS